MHCLVLGGHGCVDVIGELYSTEGELHIAMAESHTVLMLDVAGAVAMTLNMFADCEAVMRYTVVIGLDSVAV